MVANGRLPKDMIFKSNLEYQEQLFLNQFEQDGDRFLYRKYGRGAPIPVSIEEREGFRLQYRKASRRMIWGAVLIVCAAIAFGSWIAPEFIDDGPGIMVICLSVIGVIAILSVRNTTAPARALERRSPVGIEISKDEWRARHFAATSWKLLGALFLASTIVCVTLLSRSEFEEWSDYLWTIGSGVLSILGARALWLKYRLARSSY